MSALAVKLKPHWGDMLVVLNDYMVAKAPLGRYVKAKMIAKKYVAPLGLNLKIIKLFLLTFRP